MSTGAHLHVQRSGDLPIVDVGPLLNPASTAQAATSVATEIDRACREIGFFGITGHGVDPMLQDQLERSSREFFALDDKVKAAIAMPRAGRAWRGWFPVGGELTSGRPDQKEGIYFGAEHDADHPRVRAGVALHGANLFPAEPAELGPIVLRWLDEMRRVAEAVMRGIALGLGLPAHWFADNLTTDPTMLFRIFHYPPTTGDLDQWGVAEHTDYGLLTVLAQDSLGGLQVHRRDGSWIGVAPTPGVFVCNLGDMLERLTRGRYLSTPHRVRNDAGHSRLSFPFFFDPSWNATVPVLPIDEDRSSPDDRRARWDGADVAAWNGRYGDYLTAKVARVFPDLFAVTST